jgi:ERCC4-related helicase
MVDFTLRPDQIEDLAACIQNPRWMLLHDPGVGKTPIACLYTWWNWDRHGRKAVWVQPLAIIKKNRDELLRFTKFDPADVVIVQGTPAQRQAQYARKGKVYLMGADTFGREWSDLIEHNPEIDLFVGDEWHTMYSTNDSQRTQAMYQFLRWVGPERRTLPMTGTLVRGRLNSVYSALHITEPRYYPSHDAFMNYHALLDDYGKPIMWLNVEKVAELLKRHSSRRAFEEIYGKVNAVFQTQYVEMSGEQARSYEEFAEKAVLELEKVFLDGSMPGVNLIRARQILSCPEIFGLCKGETTARDALVEVHLQDHAQSGAPLIIGSASKDEQARILKLCKKLKMEAVVMNGDTSQKQRGEYDQQFRDGTIQVMIVSPLVGAFGFNWGHVDHCIFLHLDYYADSWEQLYKRMIRGTRTRPCLIQTIVYKDTVELNVLGVLERKFALANEVDATKEAVRLITPKPETPSGGNENRTPQKRTGVGLLPLPKKRA